MIILSHRGYWKDISERNQRVAFERSFDAGFGTETDLRDYAGDIVISHDMPRGGEMTFEELLQIMNGRNFPLALNIKADGQSESINRLLAKFKHTNYFTFDMSIPDMVAQIKSGLKVFTGLSDILPNPVMLSESDGVWLDCFNSDWYGTDTIDNLIENGKKVCVVSAELHKRPTEYQWKTIKRCKSLENPNFMLCTDFPDEAKRYFND